MSKNILILTDFSYCSKKAQDFAINLFGIEHVNYTILHTVNYRQAGSVFSVNLSDDLDDFYEKKMADLVNELKLKENKLNVNGQVEVGGVVSKVQSFLDKKKWDCIVLGANGSSSTYEKILGSTASALLEQIDANLLVIPVTTIEKNVAKVVFSIKLTQKEVEIPLKKAANLLEHQITSLSLMMIHNKEEKANKAKLIFNDWKLEPATFSKQLLLFAQKDEQIENQIIEEAANQEADLLILTTTNKHKSIWQRIFAEKVAEKVAERTYLPTLFIK